MILQFAKAAQGISFKEEVYKLTIDENRKILGTNWGAAAKDLCVTEHSFINLPYLKCPDGTTLVQSNAIIRFPGQTFGLVGSTIAEQAQVDEIHEHLVEMKGELNFLSYKSQDFKADRGDFKSKSVDYFIGKLNARLEQRGKPQFLGGSTLTYVDLYFFEVCQLAEAALKANHDGSWDDKAPRGLISPTLLLQNAPCAATVFSNIKQSPQMVMAIALFEGGRRRA